MPSEGTTESLAAEEARRLYEEGLSVIPLGSPGEDPPGWFRERCSSDEDAREKWPKTPRIKWADFQQRQPSEAELSAWIHRWPSCNWAILTGQRLVVVDADNDQAVEFIESGGITRTPRKVATAKGAHYYYQASGKIPIRNSANAQSKIDIRGHGGYVVAPGSVHATGVIYTEETLPGWGDTTWSELPMLTEADLQAISEFNGLKVGYNGALSFGGPGNMSFDASKMPLPADGSPVSEGGRNNAIASRVGQFIAAGMDARSILAAIKAENATYQPPLPDGEVERTAVSVMQTHTRNHPAQPIAVQYTPPEPYEPTRLEAFNAGDFEGTEPEPIEWLWKDWIARRLTVGIFAEGGTGKSLLALQMAVCMATGAPFVDGSTLALGRSLLLFCEDELSIVNRRLRRILDELGLTFADIRDEVYILCRVGEDSLLMRFDRNGNASLTPFWHDLDATIAQLQPQLLVVDTALDTFGGNPIDNQHVREYMQRALGVLAIRHDLAACFLSHVSVSGKASGSGLSGASAWRDRARVQIYMHKDAPQDVAIQVKRMKSNHAPPGAEFIMYNRAGFLQGRATVDLGEQINDIARMDFMALLERFDRQGNAVSPARNSPHYAPKVMARYARSNPKTVKTKDPAKYEDAMNQLLEIGRVWIATEARKGTKTLEITTADSFSSD